MNKFNLFAIVGIVSALIFGSTVTYASAQGNTTMTMDNMSNMSNMSMPMNNMSNMNMTMDNMSMPMNNMSNMNMTMENDSVVVGESQVAPPQVEEGSDGGEEEN